MMGVGYRSIWDTIASVYHIRLLQKRCEIIMKASQNFAESLERRFVRCFRKPMNLQIFGWFNSRRGTKSERSSQNVFHEIIVERSVERVEFFREFSIMISLSL